MTSQGKNLLILNLLLSVITSFYHNYACLDCTKMSLVCVIHCILTIIWTNVHKKLNLSKKKIKKNWALRPAVWIWSKSVRMQGSHSPLFLQLQQSQADRVGPEKHPNTDHDKFARINNKQSERYLSSPKLLQGHWPWKHRGAGKISQNQLLHAVCVLWTQITLHKPQFLVFLGVPRGPKNTSHILLTPCALWHPGFNKGIVLDTFCSIDSLSATSLYFNQKKWKTRSQSDLCGSDYQRRMCDEGGVKAPSDEPPSGGVWTLILVFKVNQ